MLHDDGVGVGVGVVDDEGDGEGDVLAKRAAFTFVVCPEYR